MNLLCICLFAFGGVFNYTLSQKAIQSGVVGRVKRAEKPREFWLQVLFFRWCAFLCLGVAAIVAYATLRRAG